LQYKFIFNIDVAVINLLLNEINLTKVYKKYLSKYSFLTFFLSLAKKKWTCFINMKYFA